MLRKPGLLLLLTILIFSALACSLPTSGRGLPTIDPATINTLLPSATMEPNPEPAPSETSLPATTTPEPSATPNPIPCMLAEFVADVNIPDGTHVNVGTSFTKTWRLKNIGTCVWTEDIRIVHISGEDFNAVDIPLLTSGVVRPDETVDASVQLTAPNQKDTYTGYFMLRSSDQTLFGIGTDGTDPFWVQIKAVKPGDTPPAFTRTLKLTNPYMQGDDVKLVQERLISIGYILGIPDGVFGPKTDAAVRAFQGDNGLTVDGAVGAQTWAKLFD